MNEIIKVKSGKDILKLADDDKKTPRQIFGRFLYEGEIGILFGDSNTGKTILANEIGAGFVLLRKPGKLPADTISMTYEKEYGTDTIEIHSDAINENDIVVLHDDLLATGGSMAAAYELVKQCNPKKIYISFLVELSALEGRKKFPADVDINSMIIY